MVLYNKIRHNNPQAFAQKVEDISAQLGINPDWLMLVMYFESGLNPKAVNRTSGATGLIQFMPTTARNMGTSTEALALMDGIAQLDYVYQYLAPYKNRMSSFVDVYLSVFYPSAVGKSSDYILGGAGTAISRKIAEQNRIFDTNHDGQISKAEVTAYIEKWANKVLGSNQFGRKALTFAPLLLGFFL